MFLRLFPHLPDGPVTASPSREELRTEVRRETDQLLLLGFLSRAVGSHGGFLSRGEAGRHEFEGLRDHRPEAADCLFPAQRAC